MSTVFRPAVRVVCLDGAARVLLLRWRDPFDASIVWEPPGGGIDPGETPLQAARRELVEETGLDPSSIVDSQIVVQRDTVWNGKHFVGPEPFFLARFAGDSPPLGRDGLMPDEQVNLTGHAWLPVAQLSDVDGRLEPPELADVINALSAMSDR